MGKLALAVDLKTRRFKMSFTNSTDKITPDAVGGGELWDSEFSITTHDFDPDIKTRKFASYDNGVLKTGVTGTLAGVVMRDITGSSEVEADDDVHERTSTVRFVRSGVVSVDVVTGKTPEFGGFVYAGDDGKATTEITTTEIKTNAEFIREVKTDVWLIRLI